MQTPIVQPGAFARTTSRACRTPSGNLQKLLDESLAAASGTPVTFQKNPELEISPIAKEGQSQEQTEPAPRKRKAAQADLSSHDKYKKLNKNFVKMDQRKGKFRLTFRKHAANPARQKRRAARRELRSEFRKINKAERQAHTQLGQDTGSDDRRVAAVDGSAPLLKQLPTFKARRAVADTEDGFIELFDDEDSGAVTTAAAPAAAAPTAADDDADDSDEDDSFSDEDAEDAEDGEDSDEDDEDVDAMAVDSVTPIATGASVTTVSSAQLHAALQATFGFTAFRQGQEMIIQRCLNQQSTMAVLPTGAGKSLCYQLAAYFLPGTTIVVTPLIALMKDQMSHMSPRIPGAFLSSLQPQKQQERVLSDLRAKKLKVLLVSPERLFDPGFMSELAGITVPLVCVDEAHCVSEWSHNFRPAYLRLAVALKQLRAGCVLALTATATLTTARDVMQILGIPEDGLVSAPVSRSNLVITVSQDHDRDEALIQMLKKPPLSNATSIIVYTLYQRQAEQLAYLLRSRLLNADSYHSGKREYDRSRVQLQFMSNQLRIVVATVAFGMGIDKPDVDAVIHYSLPKTLEGYIQEIGRAGRNGQTARCHAFLNLSDLQRLRSYTHSEGMDEVQLKQLLTHVFSATAAAGGEPSPRSVPAKPGSVIALPVERAETQFDIQRAVIITMISYLQLHYQLVDSIAEGCTVGRVTFHKKAPEQLRTNNLVVDALLKQVKKATVHGAYRVSLVKLANDVDMSLDQIRRELSQLQAAGELQVTLEEFSYTCRVLKQPQDMTALVMDMIQRMRHIEDDKLYKLHALYSVLKSVAVPTVHQLAATPDNSGMDSSIRGYFEAISSDEQRSKCHAEAEADVAALSKSTLLRSDIKAFLRTHGQEMNTGRCVARIFHGLTSPCFTVDSWKSDRMWGKYVGVDFNELRRMATEELIAWKALGTGER